MGFRLKLKFSRILFVLLIYLFTVFYFENVIAQTEEGFELTPELTEITQEAELTSESTEPSIILSATASPSPTVSSTPTLTPSPSPTPPINLSIGGSDDFNQTNNLVPLILGGALGILLAVVFLFRSQSGSKDEKTVNKETIETLPMTLSRPVVTLHRPVALRKLPADLARKYEILRKLYLSLSVSLDRKFVPVSKIQEKLDQEFPEEPFDLTKFVIHLANTYDGLIKVERVRAEGYLVQLIISNRDEME